MTLHDELAGLASDMRREMDAMGKPSYRTADAACKAQPDPLAQKVREIAAEYNIELTEEVAALIASHLSVVKKEPSQ